jgi:hypothetical protein
VHLRKSDKIFAAERTTWNPVARADHEPRPERRVIEEMSVGDVLKIVHPNYSCHGIGKACSLMTSIRNWSKADGKKFKSYHVETNIAVLTRVK